MESFYGVDAPYSAISVYVSTTHDLAPIYAPGSSPEVIGMTNPFTADGLGRWGFSASDGIYDIQIDGGGVPTRVLYDVQISGIGPGASIPVSQGCVMHPTYTDNGNGTVTVGNGSFSLCTTTDGLPLPNIYNVSGGTFNPPDNQTSYIVANYNGGSPAIQLITDVALIDEITVTPVFTISKFAGQIHSLSWDKLGEALANKLHQSIVKTQRFRRESGLLLSESATRKIIISPGKVWYGATGQTLDAFDSTTNICQLYYHSSGIWNRSDITQYNNNQYDNGTNLVSLSGGKYAVNFIYRAIDYINNRSFVLLGKGDYNLNQAVQAQPPISLPPEVSATSILVGRIIVASGATSATQIDTTFGTVFVFSA